MTEQNDKDQDKPRKKEKHSERTGRNEKERDKATESEITRARMGDKRRKNETN